MSLRLVESLVTTEALAEAFSDHALLAAMLRFEVALARAESRAGVIPAAPADAIARAATTDAFDAPAIARAARTAGTIAIPFVEALTARVRAADPHASTFVHWGATSQDVSDTALMLCVLQALPIVNADHERLTTGLRRLSDQHARTVMLGRTLLQPAPPITFGLKAAGWFASASRAGARLVAAASEACVLQFGGASGTLAALGTQGSAVATELARELGVPDPGAPWHSHRDRLALLVTSCGIYAGVLAKIARDIALLMQYEVGEAAEPGGRSSTMPHKRNPAGCAVALAAAAHLPTLVAGFLGGMAQEHERGVGGWQAEAATVAGAVQSTGAALCSMADVVGALGVDPERMRANIVATGGVVFAERAMILLAPRVGRESAQRIIAGALEAARRGNRGFAEALAGDTEAASALQPGELSTLASPEAYLGVAEQLRVRLLGGGRA